jgi:Ca2+-binding RTX toxin-like protein
MRHLRSTRQHITFATVLGAAMALSISTGATAQATTADYHPDPASRTFSSSRGGWSGDTGFTAPLCVPGVTCPAIDTSFIPSGGAGGSGDGFLRNEISGLLSLLTTSTITWQSPTYRYDGVDGVAPQSVTFTMDRRVNATDLLELLGTGATYSVLLDDQDTGTSVTLVDDAPLTNDPAWTAIPADHVAPGQLRMGDHYRTRIVTSLDLPVAAIPGGTIDYDNVRLRAATTHGSTGTARCEHAPAARQVGSATGDALVGGSGRDALAGRGGPDVLMGERGNDCLRGGAGTDVLVGQGGTDRLRGDSGNDILKGGAGRDVLLGARGHDRIVGGPGRDRIRGGAGRDRLVGGAGRDVIKAVDGRRDVIRCGPGIDRVIADRADRVLRSCERVTRRR